MVADTGATPCPSGIRPLNAPQLVQVEVDNNDMPTVIGIARNKKARAPVPHDSDRLRRTRPTELKNCPSFVTPVTPVTSVTSASSSPVTSSPKDSRRTILYEWRQVSEVLDTWRIDDEWWRKRPVSRLYYRVILEDGTVTSLFKDLSSGRWRQQQV